MVNCINLIIEMSPRFVLGRENVPCVAEVVNRSLKADCTDFTNAHGLSVSYATGQKALVDKDGKLLPTTSLRKAAEKVSHFLYKMKSNNEQLLLVAHNGHTFDQNRFLNFIHEASGSKYLDESSISLETVYLHFEKYSRTNANHLSWWIYTKLSFETTPSRLMMR